MDRLHLTMLSTWCDSVWQQTRGWFESQSSDRLVVYAAGLILMLMWLAALRLCFRLSRLHAAHRSDSEKLLVKTLTETHAAHMEQLATAYSRMQTQLVTSNSSWREAAFKSHTEVIHRMAEHNLESIRQLRGVHAESCKHIEEMLATLKPLWAQPKKEETYGSASRNLKD